MPPTPKKAVSPVNEKLSFYRFSKDRKKKRFNVGMALSPAHLSRSCYMQCSGAGVSDEAVVITTEVASLTQ